MKKTNQEIEIKLRVPDAAALRLRLKELRAHQIIPRTFESNTLYDTSVASLTRRGQLLRIRNEKPASGQSQSRRLRVTNDLLTYKGPPVFSKASRGAREKPKAASRFKIRDEIELTLGNGEQMSRILRAMGFHPVFRYEKFRTTYTLPKIRNLNVEFDETPVGLFLELEGTKASIDRAARLLGYAQSDYVTQSYGALYVADCRRRERNPSNMLFPTTKKVR